MAKVTKIVTATGRCRGCGKKNSSSVKAIGEKGTSGDWIGKGSCGQCGNLITLTKMNIQF